MAVQLRVRQFTSFGLRTLRDRTGSFLKEAHIDRENSRSAHTFSHACNWKLMSLNALRVFGSLRMSHSCVSTIFFYFGACFEVRKDAKLDTLGGCLVPFREIASFAGQLVDGRTPCTVHCALCVCVEIDGDVRCHNTRERRTLRIRSRQTLNNNGSAWKTRNPPPVACLEAAGQRAGRKGACPRSVLSGGLVLV